MPYICSKAQHTRHEEKHSIKNWRNTIKIVSYFRSFFSAHSSISSMKETWKLWVFFSSPAPWQRGERSQAAMRRGWRRERREKVINDRVEIVRPVEQERTQFTSWFIHIAEAGNENESKFHSQKRSCRKYVYTFLNWIRTALDNVSKCNSREICRLWCLLGVGWVDGAVDGPIWVSDNKLWVSHDLFRVLIVVWIAFVIIIFSPLLCVVCGVFDHEKMGEKSN